LSFYIPAPQVCKPFIQSAPGFPWRKERFIDICAFPHAFQPQPHITGIALSGTGLILSGTSGMAGLQFVLLSTTNMAAPLNQWLPVLTNNFDSNGNFIFTNPISANVPKNFYLLQLP
jgi:hypothetical protein